MWRTKPTERNEDDSEDNDPETKGDVVFGRYELIVDALEQLRHEDQEHHADAEQLDVHEERTDVLH